MDNIQESSLGVGVGMLKDDDDDAVVGYLASTDARTVSSLLCNATQDFNIVLLLL